IPPSIILIIYGVITETHIGKLYAAALIPGVLGILGYMGAVYWTVRRHPESAPPAERAPWSERILALKGVWAAVTLFVLVIGGLYVGVFTATEAAAAGAFGGFLFALAKRKLTWAVLYSILFDSAKTTAILMALVLGSGVFTEFLNVSGAHAGLMDVVKRSGLSPGQVITVICLLYVVLGALMEELSMVLLTVPLLFPVVIGLGYDPVWFGILVTVLCELGLIAPPVGMNLFVMQTVAPNVDMKDILRGIVPFIASDLGRVAIIAAFPAISLVLPKLFFS
ncbi:MAG: transporter, DctM subunit, partial [Frankiales bacterium]|nr:transporter, DctM subunit [Frankiales bacterium]